VEPIRLTVHDAARRLGLSEDAVRTRVKRGTLAAEKRGNRLYVLLEPDPTIDPTRNKISDLQEDLIAELREQTNTLRGQLKAEREANRENRRIIAGLMQRIPSIEASSVSREQKAQEEVQKNSHTQVREIARVQTAQEGIASSSAREDPRVFLTPVDRISLGDCVLGLFLVFLGTFLTPIMGQTFFSEEVRWD
jgi:DNA-binding Lrp family transcriptional regulator